MAVEDRGGEGGGGGEGRVPELLGEVEEGSVVGGEVGGVEAAGEAGGEGVELLAEAAELLGELGLGVGVGGGGGEAVVEAGEVAGEGEAVGGGVEEALQQAGLVRLRPDALELEGGRLLLL